MKKLEATPERAAIIEATYQEWLAFGRSTEPADFDTAETAISALYAHVDRPKPYFVRLSSPLAAELYLNLLTKTWPDTVQKGQLWDQLRDQLWGQLRDQLRGQLRDQLWGQLRDQLWGQLGDQLRDQLWGQLRDQLGGQLRDQLWGQLGDQLWGQLGDQLRGQLGGQLWDQLRDQLGDQLWGQRLSYMGTWFAGQWDYYWMYLDGGRRVGAKYATAADQALSSHCDIAKSCGWWYPFNDFCIVTDRPAVLHVDEQGRFHAEDGPALSYRDGISYHFWHGVAVPPHWIEDKDKLDPTEVLRSENVEQRAAGAAIVGWPKMAEKLNRKIIDGDPSTDIGALVELTMPGLVEPGRFLQALCPRNGIICEGVPRISDIDKLPIETAIAAQAWRDGLPASEYEHPLLRT